MLLLLRVRVYLQTTDQANQLLAVLLLGTIYVVAHAKVSEIYDSLGLWAQLELCFTVGCYYRHLIAHGIPPDMA